MHEFSDRPYRFSYSDLSPYAKTRSLVREHFQPGGLVLDIGCGYGALAEIIRDSGYTYAGLDVDWVALKDLADRGFETYQGPIAGTEDFSARLAEIIAGRPLAGLLLLDVLEHLVDAEAVLRTLRSTAISHGVVPLIICVPNVTHFDLAAKILQGRWDDTDTGILDRTHVGFYSARKLEAVTQRCGWSQVGHADYKLEESDQHFPVGNVALSPHTPLNALLRQVREGAGEGSDVIQFVRAYVPGTGVELAEKVSEIDGPRPFLTVLTRTQGTRLDTLQEALLCLAGQECEDFEVIVLAHNLAPDAVEKIRFLASSLPASAAQRFRVVPVSGRGRCRPLNVGVAEARGSYITVLDDDDLVLANWVSVFKELATQWPGRMLRSVVGSQQVAKGSWPDRPGYAPISDVTAPYPLEYDLFGHFMDNLTPLCGLAFPKSIFDDLGMAFDESLPVLEDWDLELQTALLCGVAASPQITAIYRRWVVGHNSESVHTAAEWEGARRAMIAKLDRKATIFPPGSITRLRELQNELSAARAEIHRLNQICATTEHTANALLSHANAIKLDFENSTSWKMTKPFRLVSTRLIERRGRRSR